MRCPNCGNELSHKDLKIKQCGSCKYILPVVSSKGADLKSSRRTLNPLPPPKRKPLTLGMNAMGDLDDFRAGEVISEAMPDEQIVNKGPSISTIEPELEVSPPRKHKKPRVKNIRFDKTIKVDILPPPDVLEQEARKKRKQELIWILSMIMFTLVFTSLIILYLR